MGEVRSWKPPTKPHPAALRPPPVFLQPSVPSPAVSVDAYCALSSHARSLLLRPPRDLSVRPSRPHRCPAPTTDARRTRHSSCSPRHVPQLMLPSEPITTTPSLPSDAVWSACVYTVSRAPEAAAEHLLHHVQEDVLVPRSWLATAARFTRARRAAAARGHLWRGCDRGG